MSHCRLFAPCGSEAAGAMREPATSTSVVLTQLSPGPAMQRRLLAASTQVAVMPLSVLTSQEQQNPGF